MHALAQHDAVFIRQRKEWLEIAVDWEARNQYAVQDADGRDLGTLVEKSGGFWNFLRRGLLRSHRPLSVTVFDSDRREVMRLSRPFFFFFSSLLVCDPAESKLGCVRRRFGLLVRRYDLLDEHNRCFAKVAGPRWRIWTFRIRGEDGVTEGSVTKKWGGALREIFTDADTFRIDFAGASGSGFDAVQRAVILAAAISIDFDFFEENQARHS